MYYGTEKHKEATRRGRTDRRSSNQRVLKEYQDKSKLKLIRSLLK